MIGKNIFRLLIILLCSFYFLEADAYGVNLFNETCSSCGGSLQDSSLGNAIRYDDSQHYYRVQCGRVGCNAINYIYEDHIYSHTYANRVYSSQTDAYWCYDYQCTECGKWENYDADHDYTNVNWTTVTYASCTTDGLKMKTCRNNSDHYRTETIPATGHNWVDTPAADGSSSWCWDKKCSNCNEWKGETQPHVWDNGVITTQPKCERTGIRTKTCTKYSTHTKTVVEPALGHLSDGIEVYNGWSDTNCYRSYCTRCGGNRPEVWEVHSVVNPGNVEIMPTRATKGSRRYTCAAYPGAPYNHTHLVQNVDYLVDNSRVTGFGGFSGIYYSDQKPYTNLSSITYSLYYGSTDYPNQTRTYTISGGGSTSTVSIPGQEGVSTGELTYNWGSEPDGVKTIVVTIDDADNNKIGPGGTALGPIARSEQQYILDRTPPTVTLWGPSPDEYGGIDPGTYEIGGTFSDNLSGLAFEDSGATGWYGVVLLDASDEGNLTDLFVIHGRGKENQTISDTYTFQAGKKYQVSGSVMDRAGNPMDRFGPGPLDHTGYLKSFHVHQLPENWTIVVNERCLEDGLEEKRCQCGKLLDSRVRPRLGHSWGEWVVTQQPTCLGEGTETRICNRTVPDLSTPEPHTNWVCGAVETRPISPLGHNMGEWIRTIEPTCTAKGEDRKYCSRCDYNERRDVDPLGHKYGEWYISKYETCTEKGENRRDCIRIAQCGSYEVTERPPLGHLMGAWYTVTPPTCTTDGLERRDCTRARCTYYETNPLNRLGHEYSTTTLPPTCIEEGYDTHVCSRCGDMYTNNVIAALGHDFGEWRVSVQPTCTTEGTEIRECGRVSRGIRCGYTETRPIPKLGHDYGDWVETIAPKCTTDGQKTKTCRRCGDVITEVVPRLGHIVDTNWSKNETTHWKICVRTGCGVTVVPNEEHMDNDEDGKCDVCEYPMIVLLGKPSVVGTYTYNHNPQTATLSGFDSARMSVTGNVQTNAGTYTITVTINNTAKYHWTDNTTGPVNLTWVIDPETIEYPGKQDYVYTGQTQVGVVAGHGYSIGGDTQGIDAQVYTATVTTDSNHVFQDGRTTGTIRWEITPKPVEVVWGTTRSFVYDRQPHTVSATCPTGIAGETIGLSTTSNTLVGIYTAIATPTGVTGGRAKLSNYEISNLTCEYQITPKDIGTPPSSLDFTITVDPTTFEYDGSNHEPSVTVKDGSYTLQEDEFSVRFENNKNVGDNTAKVIVTGEKNYTGVKEATFSITARPLYVFGVSTEKMSGVTDPVFEYTYSNNVNGEVPGFDGALSREPGEETGTNYSITVGTLHIVNNPGGNFIANNYYMVYNPAGIVPVSPGEENPTISISDYDGMIFEVNVPANGVLKLPIPEVGGNIFKVSWGDGGYNEYDSVEFPSHTYTTAGTYRVIIAGNVSIFGPCMADEITSTNVYSDFYSFKTYLTKIIKFGDIHATRLGFSQCTNLVGPLPTRSGFDNINNIENMFNGCTSLNIQIPEGFFKDLKEVISARNVFRGCTLITGEINDTLFENCTSLRVVESAFEGCINLEGAIPEDLFKDAEGIDSFAKTFKGCVKLTTIPEELFARQKDALSFCETFAGCTRITTIPENLFLQNIKATNYYRTFYNTKITAVPEQLFANNIIRKISNSPDSYDDYRETFEKCTEITTLKLNLYFIGREMFKDCTGIKDITLPNAVEIGSYAFHNDNELTTIRVGRDYLTKINQYAFLYTGANPPLFTYVNRNNELLVKYNWAEDNRKVDVEAPKGYVEIVSDRYPYTKTENVVLHITATDDVSTPSNIKIAILNDKTYTPPTQEEIDAMGIEDLYDPDSLTIFRWEQYTENKDWILNDVEGVRTVYVYFKDEMGNISNVSLDL